MNPTINQGQTQYTQQQTTPSPEHQMPSPPPVSPQRKSGLPKGIVFGVFLLALVGILASSYVLLKRQRPELLDRVTGLFERDKKITNLNELEDEDNAEDKFTDESSSDNSYVDSDYSLIFKYPKDVTLREDQDGFVFLSKLGPSQKEGTEFYDGISLTVTPDRLNNKSLKEIAEAKKTDLEKTANVEVTSGPDMVVIGKKTGYKLTAKGLGEYKYLYFAVGPENYVEVVDATQDPENQGFARTVEEIINSIDYLGPSSGS